jgi:P27 family predicted phage terminase small subunit
MARGRKPLAQEVKESTGAFARNPQRRNKAAPKADGLPPMVPKWFGQTEKAKWKELVADLSANGVISTDTREILVAYCTAYGHWMEARTKVAETGLAIESYDKDGNRIITRNGYVTELHKFREQMNKLLPELGLTPASRQKLTSLKVDDDGDDAFASIMKRMGRG